MQDETGSKRLRVRRVKSEENAADLGTKRSAKQSLRNTAYALEYVNITEESV